MQTSRESLAHSRFQPIPFATPAWEPESRAVMGVTDREPHTLTALLGQTAANDMLESATPRMFTIRAADSRAHRDSAAGLIDRMYATRGYRTSGLSADAGDHRVTLTACEHDVVMGTITVGFDSSRGLLVDELFRDEVDALRAEGRGVCEFIKLAVDGMVRSQHVLASLFHVAYIYARRLHHLHDLLIEVNPRHVRYYERKLGFVVMSEERLNPRVDAPAVLMGLDLSHAESQIEQFGGRGASAGNVRSLYPYFVSPVEERGIVAQLRRA